MRAFLASLATSVVLTAAAGDVTARPAGGNASDPWDSGVAPLVGDPVERWSFGPLTFESEPEPWERNVLVTGRDATGRRALVLLEAESGRVLARTLFSSSAPLVPSASGERVAVRTAPNRVDLFRLRGARLLQERSIVHADSVSAPRLVGDELTLREGDELVRYELGRRDPLWRARVPGAFHGAPTLRGNHVFAGWYEPDGDAHLAWLDGATGRVRGAVVLGRNALGRAPDERDALLVVAHAGSIFVRLVPGLRTTKGAEMPWARAAFDGRELRSLNSLHDLLAEPLETDGGWVAPERLRGGGARWILVEGEAGNERLVELASPEHHAWLATSVAPASRAGDVLYLGPCAADARSLAVLWRREQAPRLRSVPVPGGLLVVEGDRLRCLGSEPGPAEDVRRAERVRELVADAERALGEELAQIARAALRGSDGERARRLTEEAEDLGASGRTLELLQGEAERMRSAPPAARVKGLEATLTAREREARAGMLDALAEAARQASDAGTRRAHLRELFRRSPAHPRGMELLRQLLPRNAEPAGPDALAWLEFLELSARHPIEIVGPAGAEAEPTREEVRLAAEREGWRADLTGYQSERLLVVTAGAAPDAVARTVRAGELVCDVLESVFGGTPRDAGRLELLLYPTREEYLAHSGSDLGGLETMLGSTSGHFDVTNLVSRLFLTRGDESDARLLETSTHELTHHWLSARSAFGAPRSAPTAPGFWVVEAIATWAEELRLDPEQGTWRTAPERAASLDTLVHARGKDLLPWRALLALSFDDYRKLETRPTCELSLDWHLGSRAPRGPMQLFYAQGAALAHFLYEADGGARRKLFLQAVESYYRGTTLDVAARLGISPEELGQRVVAWVRGLWGSDLARMR
jgi:hypothetical protein